MASYRPPRTRKTQGGGKPTKFVEYTLSRYLGVLRTAYKRHQSIGGCIRAEIAVSESRTNRSEADDSGGGASLKRVCHFPTERETHTARSLTISGTDVGPYRASSFCSCSDFDVQKPRAGWEDETLSRTNCILPEGGWAKGIAGWKDETLTPANGILPDSGWAKKRECIVPAASFRSWNVVISHFLLLGVEQSGGTFEGVGEIWHQSTRMCWHSTCMAGAWCKSLSILEIDPQGSWLLAFVLRQSTNKPRFETIHGDCLHRTIPDLPRRLTDPVLLITTTVAVTLA